MCRIIPEINKMPDRLFVVQIVVVHENQWHEPATEVVLRAEREYSIDEILFAAVDENDAFETATKWLADHAFSDAHHDGRGDRTRVFAAGIHQLEEIASLSDLADRTRDLYGVKLPGFWMSEIDAKMMPAVRQKDDLEIFRVRRLFE